MSVGTRVGLLPVVPKDEGFNDKGSQLRTKRGQIKKKEKSFSKLQRNKSPGRAKKGEIK